MDPYIIVKDIDSNFCYIRYYGIDTIMMKANNYINATKICNSTNKRFREWYSMKSSKDIIRIIMKNKHEKPIIDVGLGPSGPYRYETVGTYVHYNIIPHVVAWAYPLHAVKFSKIINNNTEHGADTITYKDNNDIRELTKIICKMYYRDIVDIRESIKKLDNNYKKNIRKLQQNERFQYRIALLESKINTILAFVNNETIKGNCNS
ncbi:N1R/p28 family protein [Turkeypox virus]|uniref:N1R/p28 family protein n=1 Tax=Turkeypox virus TaxID=336486 RepID=A0A0M3ZHT6_9POXV|nr:N1R/p28 family protein [Turkeypox virus]ALA62424.1 N1R/p28 family protein [Turkeypox virus]